MHDEDGLFWADLTPRAPDLRRLGWVLCGGALMLLRIFPYFSLGLLVIGGAIFAGSTAWATVQWRITCTESGIAVTRIWSGRPLDVQRWPHEAIRAFVATAAPTALALELVGGARWVLAVHDAPADLDALVARLEEARAQNARRWREQLTAEARRDHAALGRLLERDR